MFDEAEDYQAVAGVLASAGRAHVLVLSRSPQWGRPFQVVTLARLDQAAAIELVRRTVPQIAPEDASRIALAVGGSPALLRAAAEIARQRTPTAFLADIQAFDDVLRGATRERSGDYYLDTDDPRAISRFERALEDVLESGRSPTDLHDRRRGSWRGWWRELYPSERIDAIADRAERAAEVAALTKPEGEANRNNAEAIARLIEASAAIPNLVVICSSVLLIKVNDEQGPSLVSKTLTATELRRFEEQEALLSNPAQALEFLRASQSGGSALPPG